VRFFLGGYTADGDGRATGIGVLEAGDPEGPLAGGQLAMRADAVGTDGSPSWLAWHPTLDVVYAALETAGLVQAFRRTGPASFSPLGRPVAAGELVCHVAVDPAGRWLAATCWGDGRVVRMPLDADGALVSARVAEPRPDADAGDGMFAGGRPLDELGDRGGLGRPLDELGDRGEVGDRGGLGRPLDELGDRGDRVSRAHQARFVGERTLVTTDMGLDRVHFWQVAGDGLREADRVALPSGSGPRHTVWHPSGHLYVVTELSNEIFVLAPPRDGHGWRIAGGVPVSAGATPGADFAAEIALSRDASFVVVGLRGSNTLATLRVRGTGTELVPVALAESGVDWPRHHVIARDTILVAGQRSDEVASVGFDERTGAPGRVRHRVATPSPSCLLVDRA